MIFILIYALTLLHWERILFPNLYYGLEEKESWSQKQVAVFFPMSSYVKEEATAEQFEDSLTYEMLLNLQAKGRQE